MKRYLLVIDTAEEAAWIRFSSSYKRKGLGRNLGEALMTLVKHANQDSTSQEVTR